MGTLTIEIVVLVQKVWFLAESVFIMEESELLNFNRINTVFRLCPLSSLEKPLKPLFQHLTSTVHQAFLSQQLF